MRETSLQLQNIKALVDVQYSVRSREPRGFNVKNIGFFLDEVSVTRAEVLSRVG